MKELIQSINTGAEKLYYQTRGRYTLSLEELEVLQMGIKSMLEDLEYAKKEAIHIYEEKEG